METLTDGIQRSLAGEDEDLEAKRLADANMNMGWYFLDSDLQREKEIQAIKDAQAEERAQGMHVENVGDLTKMEKPKEAKLEPKNRVQEMDEMISDFGEKIWSSSRSFKMINCSTEKTKQFASMTEQQLLRKSLESDEIIFIEGRPTRAFTDESRFTDLAENQQAQVNRELKIELALAAENYSAFDFEEEFEKKDEMREAKMLEP